MNKSLSVVFATALGAFIGAFVALDISTRFQYGNYFWSVGALFGGIVAYVAVDFRQFCAGVKRASNEVINWRPNRPYWKAYFLGFGGVAVFYNSCGVIFWPLVWWTTVPLITPMFMLMVHGSVSMLAAIVGFAFVAPWEKKSTKKKYAQKLAAMSEIGRKYILYSNPIGAMYWVVVRLPRVAVRAPHVISTGISLAFDGLAFLIEKAVAFVTRTFTYVHSSRRTICFLDATFGAAIGYHYGNAIAGAIAGAIIGLVNYELVSVRLLGLKVR